MKTTSAFLGAVILLVGLDLFPRAAQNCPWYCCQNCDCVQPTWGYTEFFCCGEYCPAFIENMDLIEGDDCTTPSAHYSRYWCDCVENCWDSNIYQWWSTQDSERIIGLLSDGRILTEIPEKHLVRVWQR